MTLSYASKNALDSVLEYKKYRDLIIHCVPYDVDSGIGQHITNKADAVQILLTMDALGALYERLCILSDELVHADLLFRLGSADGAKAIYPHEADPSRLRRERDVPIVLALVQSFQNRRLSLKPLPEFPTEEQIQENHAAALRKLTPEATLVPTKGRVVMAGPDNSVIVPASPREEPDQKAAAMRKAKRR